MSPSVKHQRALELIEAAKSGDTDSVQKLLDQGFEINGKNDNGDTALIWAICYNRSNIIKLLLDKGADVNTQENDGTTALMIAAWKGREVIVDMLLEKGAIIDLKHKFNETAIDLARLQGHKYIVEKLEKAQITQHNERRLWKASFLQAQIQSLKMSKSIQTDDVVVADEGQVELSPTILQSRKISGIIVPDDKKNLKSIGRDDIIEAVDKLLSLVNSSLMTHDAHSVMESNLLLLQEKHDREEEYDRISRYSEKLTDSVTKLADSYFCPITHEVMKDPVMCSDGHSYERYAIERWLQVSRKSPNTNELLSSTVLIPNIAVRAAIESIQEVEYARKEFADSKKPTSVEGLRNDNI